MYLCLYFRDSSSKHELLNFLSNTSTNFLCFREKRAFCSYAYSLHLTNKIHIYIIPIISHLLSVLSYELIIENLYEYFPSGFIILECVFLSFVSLWPWVYVTLTLSCRAPSWSSHHHCHCIVTQMTTRVTPQNASCQSLVQELFDELRNNTQLSLSIYLSFLSHRLSIWLSYHFCCSLFFIVILYCTHHTLSSRQSDWTILCGRQFSAAHSKGKPFDWGFWFKDSWGQSSWTADVL